MQIPQTVRVLGKIYRVAIGEHDIEMALAGAWGKCEHAHQEIWLRSDIRGDQQQEAFFHELIHCAEGNVIAEHVSEHVIYGISAGLFAILRDNDWWPLG